MIGAVRKSALPGRAMLVARLAGKQANGDGIYSHWVSSGRLGPFYWTPSLDPQRWRISGEVCGFWVGALAVVDDFGTLVVVEDKFSHVVPATEQAQ